MRPNPSRNLWCRQRGLGAARAIVVWAIPFCLAFWAIVALLVVL
jgi:hypothetical protein